MYEAITFFLRAIIVQNFSTATNFGKLVFFVESKSHKEHKKIASRSKSLSRVDSKHGLRGRSESNSSNCSQALSTTNRFSVLAPDESLSVVSCDYKVSKSSAFSKDNVFPSSSRTSSSMNIAKYDKFLEASKNERTEVIGGCSQKYSISFPERQNSHCESEGQWIKRSMSKAGFTSQIIIFMN